MADLDDLDGPPFAPELAAPSSPELVVVQGVNPPTELITSASGHEAPPFAGELLADQPPHLSTPAREEGAYSL